MRFGFVANANTLECKANHRFRLASYSEARLFETVAANLDCMEAILRFAVRHGVGFFRISSDTVPFASHPICRADWVNRFADRFAAIGAYIRRHKLRISMHPGQYTVLNAPDERIRTRSIAELRYHAALLDVLGLDRTARIQLHVGGVYGNKEHAIAAFCRQYEGLEGGLRKRLVIENDERNYSLRDCLSIHGEVGIPVVFDTFHHQCLSAGESVREGLAAAAKSWSRKDGPLMVDYSSQQPGRRRGAHADSLDEQHFLRFLEQAAGFDCDVMLELRDKEVSALKAVALARRHGFSK